jgi:hypothetical protein
MTLGMFLAASADHRYVIAQCCIMCTRLRAVGAVVGGADAVGMVSARKG